MKSTYWNSVPYEEDRKLLILKKYFVFYFNLYYNPKTHWNKKERFFLIKAIRVTKFVENKFLKCLLQIILIEYH